jgi:hypothetical protein
LDLAKFNPSIHHSPDQTAAAVTNARNSASVYDTLVTNRLAVPLHDQIYFGNCLAGKLERSESDALLYRGILIMLSVLLKGV